MITRNTTANYKASMVMLDEVSANCEEDKVRRLKLLLSKAEEEQRFKKMLGYLRARENRGDIVGIKLADMKFSRDIGADITPDDMFTLHYLQIEKNQAQHYHNLITETGTTAFDHWRV